MTQVKLTLLEEKLSTVQLQLDKLQKEENELQTEIALLQNKELVKENQIYYDEDGENKFYYVINTVWENDLDVTLYAFIKTEQEFSVTRYTSHICNIDFTTMRLTNQEELAKFIQNSHNYFNINQKEN